MADVFVCYNTSGWLTSNLYLEDKEQRRETTNPETRRHMPEDLNYKSQSSIVFYTDGRKRRFGKR